MRIAFLGAGAWGFTLASLLARKGHELVVWTRESDLRETLNKTRVHPRLKNAPIRGNLRFTGDLEEALDGAELLGEAVTAAGIRPVFEQIKPLLSPDLPIVLCSKGIEQKTHLLPPQIICDVLRDKPPPHICLGGPCIAAEVICELPTSVVCAAADGYLRRKVSAIFQTDTFRVYPNSDSKGVAFGGAVKNVMAIAAGLSDGLGLGDNAKAALMTRGLHEICKLADAVGCRRETLYGLGGLGDLCVTCLSTHSRNYQFGHCIAKGLSAEEAQEKIGMVVEGAYTSISAVELARKYNVPVPIFEGVYSIIYEGMEPRSGVPFLMKREVKDEHL